MGGGCRRSSERSGGRREMFKEIPKLLTEEQEFSFFMVTFHLCNKLLLGF